MLGAPASGIYPISFNVASPETDNYPQDNTSNRQVIVSNSAVGVLERESVDASGVEGNGYSYDPAVSDTGRFVAFETDAYNLLANAEVGYAVVVRDNCIGAPAGCTPSITPVSVDNSGVVVYGEYPAISGNGRYVAFSSSASTLPGANSYYQLYVRDTCIGAAAGCTPTTALVSGAPDGSGGNNYTDYYNYTGITPDGRYIAFTSYASNLTADSDLNNSSDVFLRDTCFGADPACVPTTILVSASVNGGTASGYSEGGAVSGNGRYVAFDTYALDISANPNNYGYNQIYVRDTCIGAPAGCTPATTLVSLNTTGGPATGDSYSPAISRDGRFLAFESYANDLVTGDTNLAEDIFVRDTCLGAAPECAPSTQRLAITSGESR
jgi:hypothetical protein